MKIVLIIFSVGLLTAYDSKDLNLGYSVNSLH